MNLSNLRSNKSSILDKTLTKGKNEVSLSLYALVFSEIVQYSQKNSQSVGDLSEKVDLKNKIKDKKSFQNNSVSCC